MSTSVHDRLPPAPVGFLIINQRGLTLSAELGMRPLQAHCHRYLGKLYQWAGQTEHARAELSAAIEMRRDMEMTFWLPETEAILAEAESI